MTTYYDFFVTNQNINKYVIVYSMKDDKKNSSTDITMQMEDVTYHWKIKGMDFDAYNYDVTSNALQELFFPTVKDAQDFLEGMMPFMVANNLYNDKFRFKI